MGLSHVQEEVENSDQTTGGGETNKRNRVKSEGEIRMFNKVYTRSDAVFSLICTSETTSDPRPQVIRGLMPAKAESRS